MKDEIRVLGIDDGFFLKNTGERVLVVGAVLRGSKELDGVLSCRIKKDGNDVTERIASLINGSRHKKQLKYVMTNGITFGGFNVLDICELNRKTNLPVISVLRKKPDFRSIEKALDHLPGKKERLDIIKKAGELYTYRKIYFQASGLSEKEAEEVIDKTINKSNIPEPIRMAHLIASGVTYGESTKRA